MRTREEHIEWCKVRARKYLDHGDAANAIASMGSDLMKHEELKNISAVMMPIGLMYAIQRDLDGARRWVEGFQ